MENNGSEFYTAQEAAARLDVHYKTVYRYIKLGHLKIVRITPHSPIMIPRSEIDRLLTAKLA